MGRLEEFDVLTKEERNMRLAKKWAAHLGEMVYDKDSGTMFTLHGVGYGEEYVSLFSSTHKEYPVRHCYLKIQI